jgi:hypothetical protein
MPSRIVAKVWGAAPAAICCFFDLAGMTSSPSGAGDGFLTKNPRQGPKVPPRLLDRAKI